MGLSSIAVTVTVDTCNALDFVAVRNGLIIVILESVELMGECSVAIFFSSALETTEAETEILSSVLAVVCFLPHYRILGYFYYANCLFLSAPDSAEGFASILPSLLTVHPVLILRRHKTLCFYFS